VAPRRRPLERPVPEGHARAGRRPHGEDEWEDADDNERTTFKIEARRIGILPYRIQAVPSAPGRWNPSRSTAAEGDQGDEGVEGNQGQG
jgi:hypothetical protein